MKGEDDIPDMRLDRRRGRRMINREAMKRSKGVAQASRRRRKKGDEGGIRVPPHLLEQEGRDID